MRKSLAFFTNYLNEHQLPLCLAWDAMNDVEFTLVAVADSEGIAGRRNMNNDYDFVLREYESDTAAKEAMRHAVEDDVVIFGHMDGKEQYVRARMKLDKLTFRSAERSLKRGYWWRFAPPKALRMHNWYTRYKRQNMYMLCCSAFAAGDLKLCGWPLEKCFNWGYFPDSGHKNNCGRAPAKPASILWAARLIEWKRPFVPLQLAKRLKESGYEFHLTIAGDGPLRSEMLAYIEEHNISDVVDMLGLLTGEETKRRMGESDIYITTSSCKEGWGTTVNEAMGAGCAVVASASIGSAPFLIDDGVNGLLYDDLNENDLYLKVCKLLENRELAKGFGTRAVVAMNSTWSAGEAARRFVGLAEALSAGQGSPYVSGPCAPSKFLKNGWYHKESNRYENPGEHC